MNLPRSSHPLFTPALLLAVLSLVAIVLRPLTPIDETRYISVAWEMWLRDEYLVLYKNGAPYSHKPPLLFWLYNLGWAITGVNEWWPRLVSPLFSLGSLALTLSIARRLWPDDAATGPRSVWILTSGLLWMLFSTSAMFDVMLSFFVLLGLRGLLVAAHDSLLRGFAWLALAIGGGVLAKGPVVLLHLLPAALLAPLWASNLPRKRWYIGLLLAFLGGATLALAWAIPAAVHGGEEYRRMIFWGQTANRMVDSFAHKRPVWWYLPLLPLLLFPWLFWPTLWKQVWQRFKAAPGPADRGLRFCLAWLLPGLLAFSLISGKQVHYLVPLVPAFALIASRLTAAAPPGRFSITALAAVGAITYVLLLAGLSHYLWQRYDITPLAQQIRALQQQGIPVANLDGYHAQYQFAGRLEAPVEEIDKIGRAAEWFAAHPNGVALHYTRRAAAGPALFDQPYLGEQVYLLDASQARAWGLTK